MVARTTKAPITVGVPKEYEGTFVLPSRSAPSFIDRAAYDYGVIHDPAGLGRYKVLLADDASDNSTLEGRIWWGDKERKGKTGPSINGSIVIDTTMFPAMFKLLA